MHPLFRNLGVALGLCALISNGHAFTPSQQQIDQFNKMSPAQQRQLAEQAGIDLDALPGNATPTNQPQLVETAPQQQPSNMPDLSSNSSPSSNSNSDPGPGPRFNLKSNQQQADTRTPTPQPSKQTLTQFGSNLFTDSGDGFRPAVTVPIPADYVLGPGDTMVVQLYGKENATYSLVVNREGQVQFPQIGPVNLAGLTFSKAQSVIENIVGEQKIGVKASITMGALRTIRVFVLGDVRRPGSFTVGSLSTLTNALFESGGVSNVGSLRNIQLKRNGQVETSLDLYDLLLHGDTSKDARLLPGDVIFVPPLGKTVAITGEVQRPAIYEIKDALSAWDLVKLAGGLTSTAHARSAQLIRINDEGETNFLNIDLAKPENRDFSLANGDQLTVPSTLEFVNNQITVNGHVKRPGDRAWRPNLHFSDVIEDPTAMLPNPDIHIGLIQRFDPKTLEVSVKIFAPQQAWENPKSNMDPVLQKRDIVRLFDYRESRSDELTSLLDQLQNQANYNERTQTVAVSGSVRFPGDYPLTSAMTTEDLIRLAGGLTESAMGTNGEITRYSIDESRQRTVEHIHVDFAAKPALLQPGDSLQVKQIPLWKNKESVKIQGEVLFPGTYTIIPGETLTNLITRAGGLTMDAYPEGAIFTRQELRELEAQRIAEFKGKLQSDIASQTVASADDSHEIDVTEAESLLNSLDSLKPLGRMVIDLPEILKLTESADFKLEDGDSLIVPRFKPSVTVVGEVQYPTSHFYEKAYDAFTYIGRSGGFKKHADEGRVYVVKANGLVVQPPKSRWFRADGTKIAPGDTIVVPLETDKVDKLSLWAQVTEIMWQGALGVAAVKGL